MEMGFFFFYIICPLIGLGMLMLRIESSWLWLLLGLIISIPTTWLWWQGLKCIARLIKEIWNYHMIKTQPTQSLRFSYITLVFLLIVLVFYPLFLIMREFG